MARFEKFQKASRKQIISKSSNGEEYVDYRDVEMLRRLLSPNGKILGRKRTGLCADDQRHVAQAIKRARHMALLPFTSATL